MSPLNRSAIGAYLREQREQAKISLRQLAERAGVSEENLSQIERGLRRPSADILQQIARGLWMSAEALYVQAGILDQRVAGSAVTDAIRADAELTERQKQMLVEIYESFRKEIRTARVTSVEPADPAASSADESPGAAADQQVPEPPASASRSAEPQAAAAPQSSRSEWAEAAAGAESGAEPAAEGSSLAEGPAGAQSGAEPAEGESRDEPAAGGESWAGAESWAGGAAGAEAWEAPPSAPSAAAHDRR